MKHLGIWAIIALLTASASVFSADMSTLPKVQVIEGEWQQGAVIKGLVEPGTQLRYLDRDVRVSNNGEFVIGLGRDAKALAVLISSLEGVDTRHEYAVTAREYRIQRVDGVPSKTVNPNKAQVARSRAEAKLVWAARQRNEARTDFLANFQWPLLGPITGVYGSQRVYNGEPRRPHFGVDVAAPTGTRVRAPAPGVVTLVHSDMFFSGGTLMVDHGHGLSSAFIHLSKILVEPGQVIVQGQEIAEVGATGRVTGPHLDWRMSWFDQRVDPQLLVGDMPKAQAAHK